jgi:hypothetical protein
MKRKIKKARKIRKTRKTKKADQSQVLLLAIRTGMEKLREYSLSWITGEVGKLRLETDRTLRSSFEALRMYYANNVGIEIQRALDSVVQRHLACERFGLSDMWDKVKGLQKDLAISKEANALLKARILEIETPMIQEQPQIKQSQ